MADIKMKPPRISPPVYESHSHSPVPSPSRFSRKTSGPQDGGYLRDLSPSVALRAFSGFIDADADCGSDEYKLIASIKAASPAEKALGARIASAAQKLRSWCEEIEQWSWAGTFAAPKSNGQEATKASSRNGLGGPDGHVGRLGPLEFWGSMPSTQVESYEGRIREINLQLEDLEMDELKQHVLAIHGPDRAKARSTYSQDVPGPTLLDDFSFIITLIILQALPSLSILSFHIDTWATRLAVLREVPGFLRELKETQKALRFGWEAIEPPAGHSPSESVLTTWKDAIRTLTTYLQGRVADLGQRLDMMLDSLVMRGDTIPDEWIESFETLEADYSCWVVEAQKRILEANMRRSGRLIRQISPPLVRVPLLDNPSYGDLRPSSSREPSVRIPPFQFTRPKSIGALPKEWAEQVPQGKQTMQASQSRSRAGLRLSIPSDTADPIAEIKVMDESLEPREDVSVGTVSQDGESDEGEIGPEEQWDDYFVPPMVKRASVASIEAISRSQVKSIEIRRNSSSSSLASVPVQRTKSHTPDSHSLHYSPIGPDGHESPLGRYPHSPGSLSAPHLRASSPLRTEFEVRERGSSPLRSELEAPHTPGRERGQSFSSMTSAILSQPSSPPSIPEESPSFRRANQHTPAKVPRPPLNAIMVKRRLPQEINPPWPPRHVSESFIDGNSTLSQGSANRIPPPTLKKPTEDLDTQISNILTTIPAHIRLASGPELDAPEVKATRRRPLSAFRLTRPKDSPSYTLSPVKNVDSSTRHTLDRDDVRLYHLQSGKEKPIKLFVRQVGEHGERVMVRVGGGWADLGEYLRQYAEHHGRRTVSEGKFEVIGIKSKADGSTSRPSSASGLRKSILGTPKGGLDITPNRIRSTSNSTPQNAATILEQLGSSGSSKASWKGDEVGLAGPTTKKLDLSEEKLGWIEGMMNQAKKLGIAGRGEFGDLGKVGGTKRVFMRSPTPQPPA